MSTKRKAKKRAPAARGVRAKAEAREALFIEHYLANGRNGTQAAIAAGYAPKSAHVTASRLLSRDKVAAKIAERTEAAVEEAGIAVDKTLYELACIAGFNPQKLVDPKTGKALPLHKLDEATARAIATVEFDEKGNMVKVRAWDKNTALANAMRYLGLMKPDVPIVPPAPPGPTVINAQNVLVMDPHEAYRRMLTAPKPMAKAA